MRGKKGEKHGPARLRNAYRLVDRAVPFGFAVKMVHRTEYQSKVESPVREAAQIERVAPQSAQVRQTVRVFLKLRKVYFQKLHGGNFRALFRQCDGIAPRSGAELQHAVAGL